MIIPCITMKELALHLIHIREKTVEVRNFTFRDKSGGGRLLGLHANKQCWTDLPHIKAGHIVSVVQIIGIYALDDGLWDLLRDRHRIAGETTYAHPKGWAIGGVWFLETPIPAEGRLSLWDHDIGDAVLIPAEGGA